MLLIPSASETRGIACGLHGAHAGPRGCDPPLLRPVARGGSRGRCGAGRVYHCVGNIVALPTTGVSTRLAIRHRWQQMSPGTLQPRPPGHHGARVRGRNPRSGARCATGDPRSDRARSDAGAHDQTQLQRLADCLATLQPTDSIVLTLRYNRGLPLREVAATIGKSEAAVRKRLLRVLQKSATSGKAGGLKKVEPLKAVDVVNRSKRFGCEPPTGGPAYHRSI